MYGDAGNAPEPSIDYCIALFIRKIFQNRRCAAHPKLAHPYAGCETDDSDRYPCSIPRHLEPFSAACTASLRARRIGSYCLHARSLCNLTEKGSRQAFRTAALATLRLLAVLDVLSASARLASAAVRNAWVSLAPVSPRRAVPGILMLQIQTDAQEGFPVHHYATLRAAPAHRYRPCRVRADGSLQRGGLPGDQIRRPRSDGPDCRPISSAEPPYLVALPIAALQAARATRRPLQTHCQARLPASRSNNQRVPPCARPQAAPELQARLENRCRRSRGARERLYEKPPALR